MTDVERAAREEAWETWWPTVPGWAELHAGHPPHRAAFDIGYDAGYRAGAQEVEQRVEGEIIEWLQGHPRWDAVDAADAIANGEHKHAAGEGE